MTSFAESRVCCAACGFRLTVTVLQSTHRSGSCDLDLRPPEMERGTLHVQIQACGACGYCAPSIADELPAGAELTMQRAAYMATLQRRDWTTTACQMACWGLIAEGAQRWPEAGWAALKAAWCCDDADKPVAAAALRETAADRFERGMLVQQPPCSERGASQALLADLWRRAGHFDIALAMAGNGLALHALDPLGRPVLDMLRCQVALARRSDADRHTIHDAERMAPDWAARQAAVANQLRLAVERREQQKQAERERQSPRLCIEALAALTPELQQATAGSDGATASLDPWLARLPLPPSMAAIMQANLRAYSWPALPALAAFALATYERLDAADQARHTEAAQVWLGLVERHGPLMAYLRWCLRDVTANEWHYAPAQRGGEGTVPPRYPAGESP